MIRNDSSWNVNDLRYRAKFNFRHRILAHYLGRSGSSNSCTAIQPSVALKPPDWWSSIQGVTSTRAPRTRNRTVFFAVGITQDFVSVWFDTRSFLHQDDSWIAGTFNIWIWWYVLTGSAYRILISFSFLSLSLSLSSLSLSPSVQYLVSSDVTLSSVCSRIFNQ